MGWFGFLRLQYTWQVERILFIHKGATTFVLRDLGYLKAAYKVDVVSYEARGVLPIAVRYARNALICTWLALRCRAVVCQFAGHHSLWPILVARVLGKPSVVLANGSDCVSFPTLGYGHFRKRLLGRSTCMSFRLASLIIPLHASLVRSRPTYHDIDGPEQGILHHCKNLRTPIEPLGYGFDASFWKPSGERISNRFITVASNAHLPHIQVIKGLDMILEVAPRFPEYEFIIVGAREGSFPHKPVNVVEVPFVPNEELPRWYSGATFYLQLSVSEGFGNALCEAMLCGCLPIVSDVGAMPEIVGDAGFVVRERDADVLERILRDVISADSEVLTTTARTRILAERPEALRRSGLLERLAGLMRER